MKAKLNKSFYVYELYSLGDFWFWKSR